MKAKYITSHRVYNCKVIPDIMTEQLRHQLPMSEGVFTFRVEQTENGSLVASLHREPGNHTPIIAGGYYNRYRHRYHDNTLPAIRKKKLVPVLQIDVAEVLTKSSCVVEGQLM